MTLRCAKSRSADKQREYQGIEHASIAEEVRRIILETFVATSHEVGSFAKRQQLAQPIQRY